MLDKFKIRTKLRLNPDAVEKPEWFAEEQGWSDYKVSRYTNKRTGRQGATIEIFSNRAIRIACGKNGEAWSVFAIEANAPSLIWEHNGRTISCDLDLSAVLTRLQDVVSRCLLPGQDNLVVPGLSPRSKGYFDELEINWHIHHTGESWRNMANSAIYKPAMVCEGQSTTRRGGALEVIEYRKDLEMKKDLRKFGDPSSQCPVRRIEVKAKGHKLTDLITAPWCVEEVDGKSRVVRFSVEVLREAFMSVMKDTTGVFGNKTEGLENGLPLFVATVAREEGVAIERLVAIYEKTKPIQREQARALRRNARKAHAAMVPLRIEDVFNDSTFLDQPQVELPDLERRLSAVRKQARENSGPIWRVYSGHKAKGTSWAMMTLLFSSLT